MNAAVTSPPDIRRAATKDERGVETVDDGRSGDGLAQPPRVAGRVEDARAASTALDSWSVSVVLRSALSTMPPARNTSRARGASALKREASPAATQSFSEPSAF